jgi:hypothetical protein
VCWLCLAEQVVVSLTDAVVGFTLPLLVLSSGFSSGIKQQPFITIELCISQHPKRSTRMPLFNRKPQAADANTATAVGSSDPPATEKKTGLKGLLSKRPQTPAQERAAYDYDNLNARPRFGQWLKGTVC